MPITDKIKPLVPDDDSRTMFSAATANELIYAINAFLGLKGTGGIRVTKADAGFVIDGSNVSGSASGSSGGSTSYTGSTFNYACTCRYV
jgi:hypothetical protein